MQEHPVGGGRVTTFCEQAIISENRMTPVPGDTPVELCTLLGCGLSTALGTIESEAAVKFGESVLIVGCGGLGCNLIRAAKIARAHPIVVIDVDPSKARTALWMGATRYVSFGRIDPAEIGKFDVIIDTAGTSSQGGPWGILYAPGSMEKTLPLLAPSGRFIMLGQTPPGADVVLHNARHMFEGEGKTIKATQGGGFRPEIDIPRYVRMWETGILDISGIISIRVPLTLINRGLDLVRAGKASRVLIEMLKAKG